MGIPPAFRVSTLPASLSMQITSWPNSDSQAPDTRPTYPVPMMAIRMESPTDCAFFGLDAFQLQAACPKANGRARAAKPHVRLLHRGIAIKRHDARCGDPALQQCFEDLLFTDVRRNDDGQGLS